MEETDIDYGEIVHTRCLAAELVEKEMTSAYPTVDAGQVIHSPVDRVHACHTDKEELRRPQLQVHNPYEVVADRSSEEVAF